jgi:uncharacterized membrane protein YqaE (UPF0057 family)
MRKFLALFIALSFTLSSFASGSSVLEPVSKPVNPKATDIIIPIGSSGQKISLSDFSTMSIKEAEKLTGKKFSLANKLGFKIVQKKLRKSISSDGNITVNSNGKSKAGASIPKVLYVIMALVGLGWLAMGILDNFSGSNWWIGLLLYFLFFIPGVIFTLIKMKDYYN